MDRSETLDIGHRIVSFLGIFVLVALAWLMSSDRRRFPWRIVLVGTGLQFAMAIVVLRTRLGKRTFDLFASVFNGLLNCVDEGSRFVFGPRFNEFYFAFKVLPTIIFFSAFMSVMYYLGVMQWIVRGTAWLMQRAMGASGTESLAAAANIFLGQTEAPLVIRPYLARMTCSEINAVMIGGFASISGSLVAVFSQMGIDLGHLLTASVISAPAGLLIAKVLEPEGSSRLATSPEPRNSQRIEMESNAVNLVDAAASGARDGLFLALNVGAMLIAFLALIKCVDALIGFTGGLFEQQWSLSAGLAYIFSPIAWIMGVETKDCFAVGELLGIKTVANEFIAYDKLSSWLKEGSGIVISHRSQVIATYALCGFANFGSIGIQIGGLGALVPERRSDFARLGFRAMWGGAIANCMTACVAGVLL